MSGTTNGLMEEDRRGRLAAGVAADFTVLDADPFKDGEESLLNARVLRTVVGGHTEYIALFGQLMGPSGELFLWQLRPATRRAPVPC